MTPSPATQCSKGNFPPMGGEDPRKAGERSYPGSKIKQSARRAAEHSAARFARREKIAAFPENSLFPLFAAEPQRQANLFRSVKNSHVPRRCGCFSYGKEIGAVEPNRPADG